MAARRWVEGAEKAARLRAWQRGQTGFPLVDAGMRELWATGWMQQSVRMAASSFLVDVLQVNWVEGARGLPAAAHPLLERCSIHTPFTLSLSSPFNESCD